MAAERAGQAGAVGHGVEIGQLHLVQPMVGVVGAGEVGHQKFGAGVEDEGGDRLPFGFLHAEAVHAGVKLDAEARGRKGFPDGG